MATTTARVTPGTHNPSISAQTVRNRLREGGLRACRPVVRQVLTRHHRQQRRLWAQTHCRWTRQNWQKVLFTDESRFCLTRGDGRICGYHQRNERYTEACTLERDRFGGGGSVMVWGGVSQHHLVLCVISCKTGMSVFCHSQERARISGRTRAIPPRNLRELAGVHEEEMHYSTQCSWWPHQILTVTFDFDPPLLRDTLFNFC